MLVPVKKTSRKNGVTKDGTSNMTDERLVWARNDIEQRFGLRGLPYTRVRGIASGIVALILTVITYLCLMYAGANWLSDMFLLRGNTPYIMVLFTYWAFLILAIKQSKLRLQCRALKLDVVPKDASFVLSVTTVDDVMHRLYELSDDPKHFVLFNRIYIAISNLRNLGRVTDVGEILRARAEHDESVFETSYSLIRNLVWAIPILGFIGTVEGLSSAIGGFGRVLSDTQDPALLIGALKGVTGGLATAFETTLVALIAALLVQMAMTSLKKSEEEFLNDCEEYCHRNVVNRLRLTALESA